MALSSTCQPASRSRAASRRWP